MALNWDDIGSGLFKAGIGAYRANQGVDLANQQLQAIQNAADSRRQMYVGAGMQDLLNKLLAGSNAQLDAAKGFDPKVASADWLAQQQALLAPQRAKQQQDLFRQLQAKGLLGLSTYGQGGLAPGAASNPYMAALTGAQATQDQRLAAEATAQGNNQLDALLKRSTGLFNTANSVDSVLNDRTSQAAVTSAQIAADKAKSARKAGITGALPGLFDSIVKGSGGITNIFSGAKDWFSGLFDRGGEEYFNPSPFESFYTPNELSDVWL